MISRRALLLLCVLACTALTSYGETGKNPAAAPTSALAPYLGFGAESRGGSDGRVLMVTRLDDRLNDPPEGTLRWAISQRGPRIVKFAVCGDIELKNMIWIREPYLTIDGSDAPGNGVCIRYGSLMFGYTHDIIVRYVRIRLGKEAAERQRRYQGGPRPLHTTGLECVALNSCHHVLFDHCSLSWSCKEIFDINHSQAVTIQWCILSEPLAGPTLHPYGDDHACIINASAGTLSVHHCLMEHFTFRGPQFECNDMLPQDHFAVKMEALNNVIADFEQTGSRYSVGVETGSGVDGKTFRFQFLNNLYLKDHRRTPPVQALTNHGVTEDVRVCVAGNIERYPRKRLGPIPWPPSFSKDAEDERAVKPPYWQPADEGLNLGSKLVEEPLFTTTATEHLEPVEKAAAEVLAEAGCSLHRDEYDQRMVEDVRLRRFGRVLRPGS